MNETAIAKREPANSLEQVLIGGDLASLSPQDRILYYKQTCESLGLNPLTKPFEYIKLNGKLTLYARKDATDQLRKINGVSIEKPDIQQIDNLIIVTVAARDASGRVDSDIGVVQKTDMNGSLPNALMKAVTKAKRRVTLSICGLGMLDETEVETIPNAEFPKQIEAAKPEVVLSPEDQAATDSLREQLSELLALTDYSEPKKAAGMAKFDQLKTISEMEDAVATVRQKVEVRLREIKIAEIKDGLAGQGWDGTELDKYLEQFSLSAGLDSAGDEQINAIHKDMTDSGMII